MLDPIDLLDFSNAEGQSKVTRHRGKKLGRARGFFVATGGKATGAYSLVGADGITPLVVPKGALVTRAFYKVLTNFASVDSTATIALSVVAANDVATAAAVSGAWQTGVAVLGTPVSQTASTWLTTTADSSVVATVAVEALTAGKLVCFVEWAFYGDVPVT